MPAGVLQHGENDLNVPFVSGSARFDAMVIVPCSMATLGRIASGCSDSALPARRGCFFEGAPQADPGSARDAVESHSRAQRRDASRSGRDLLPAIPSFYSRPQSIDAVADTVVWRILDQIGLPNPRAYRWRDDEQEAAFKK